MEWIEHNQRWLAIVMLVIGGLSLIAGIGFVVLDHYLVTEYHMNAATIMEYYNKAISAFGDMNGAMADDQLFNGIGGIVSVYAQGAMEQYLEQAINSADAQTQLVIRAAQVLLPWVPYKVWFILFGLVFIGIGLALLLDKWKWILKNKSADREEQWLRCHACGKASLVSKHTQFCPLCGAPARPEPAPAPRPAPAPKPVYSRAYCPKCHNALADGVRFCGACGNAVAMAPAQRVCERCGMPYPSASVTCPHCAGKRAESPYGLNRGGNL